MEYEADGFNTMTEKLEFLTRLLIFIEPRLNVIELAPKGTGKSFVFGNLSKYGWLVSGGKVTFNGGSMTQPILVSDRNPADYGVEF